MSNPFPFQMILAAKAGNPDTLSAIIQHYTRYIVSLSRRPFYDEFGKQYEFVDEEIRQQIETRLMLQIVCKFDPYKLPKGEILEIR